MPQNGAGAELGIKQNMALGLQHFSAVFISNMTPMLILINLLHVPEAKAMPLMQATMVITGLVTLLQLKRIGIFGSELPLLIGPNSNFIPILAAVALSYGLEGVVGATLVAGFVAIFFSIFLKYIRKLFPNIITATVVLAVGLSLITISMDFIAGGADAADYGSISNLFLGFLVFMVAFLLQQFGRGFVKKAAILIGIFAGYIVAIFMHKVNFAPLMQAKLVSLPEFMPVQPAFHLDAIIAVSIIYIAVCVKMIGDTSGITMGVLGREPTTAELRGDISSSGLASVIAGFFGLTPFAIASLNVGLVIGSKVVSRASMAFCALFMLLAGLFPKISVLFSSMPPAVLGGALFLVFSRIIVTGIQLLSREDLNGRNCTIVALALGLGFSVISVPQALAGLPEMIQLIFGKSLVNTTFVAAVLLNLLLPKAEKDETK